MTTSPDAAQGGILLALTDPLPGREDDYHGWYTNRHMLDALQLPGFVDGQRFEMVRGDEPTNRYLALYHLSDIDLAAESMACAQAARDAAGRREDPKALFYVPPVIDPRHRGWWMRPITPIVSGG